MIPREVQRPDLLDELAPAARTALVERLRQRTYRRGQVLFNDGDIGDRMYLLTAGRLVVQLTTPSGTAVIMRVVQPGEMVGEMALVQADQRRTGRVAVVEDATTLEIRRADFHELRELHPTIDRLLVQALTERVVAMSALALELVQPPEVRIWTRLGVLSDAYGDEAIRLAQEELAQATGTTRQTVNRVLQRGVRAGVIELGRGVVRVIDRAALDELAGHG